MEGASAVLLTGFEMLRLRGADAGDYLNRRLSQEIESVEPGDVRRAALLDASGKVLADMEVARGTDEEGEDVFLLLAPMREGYDLKADLERFLFSEDCKVEQLGTPILRCAPEGDELPGPNALRSEYFLEAEVAAGDPPAESLSPRALEAERIERGLPLYPIDFDETNTPLDAGLYCAVDMDKGCFPGQETIAKIVNLGHPAKALVRVELEGDGDPPRDDWSNGDGDKGRLTSAVLHPVREKWIGLMQVAWRAREIGAEWTNGGWKAKSLGAVEHR
jgi:folate-binding protein YgfZ